MAWVELQTSEPQMVNGIIRQVPKVVDVYEDDPALAPLAAELFEVTSRLRGSLCVPYAAQPGSVREYHEALAEAAIKSLRGDG